jgi:hypothetical protein
MSHNRLEPDKKKPVNELTLRERYPGERFSGYLADLTLKQGYSHILDNTTNQKLIFDILIEAAKENNYRVFQACLSKMMRLNDRLDPNNPAVSQDTIKKYINAIIPISLELELVLCEQNMPIELLEIISDKIKKIDHLDQYNNECADLLLKEYINCSIVEFLEKAGGYYQGMMYPLSAERRKYYADNAIDNLKFLCEVIGKYFPNNQMALQTATRLCRRYQNMMCQFNPQVEKELPLLFNSTQSVQRHAPTML